MKFVIESGTPADIDELEKLYDTPVRDKKVP